MDIQSVGNSSNPHVQPDIRTDCGAGDGRAELDRQPTRFGGKKWRWWRAVQGQRRACELKQSAVEQAFDCLPWRDVKGESEVRGAGGGAVPVRYFMHPASRKIPTPRGIRVSAFETMLLHA